MVHYECAAILCARCHSKSLCSMHSSSAASLYTVASCGLSCTLGANSCMIGWLAVCVLTAPPAACTG